MKIQKLENGGVFDLGNSKNIWSNNASFLSTYIYQTPNGNYVKTMLKDNPLFGSTCLFIAYELITKEEADNIMKSEIQNTKSSEKEF